MISVYGRTLRRLFLRQFDPDTGRVQAIYPPRVRKKRLAEQALQAIQGDTRQSTKFNCIHVTLCDTGSGRRKSPFDSEEQAMTEKQSYDVVILGTGPAGLQAAIHAARKKASVLVLGKESKSSIYHHHVENYCCILSTTGEDIIKAGRQQAAAFGAELVDEDVLSLAAAAGRFRIRLESGSDISAGAVILATGTARNRLGVPGEKELLGRGVSYCVECDCNFYKGNDVAVVGDGSAAASGALTMLAYARSVHLVCRNA